MFFVRLCFAFFGGGLAGNEKRVSEARLSLSVCACVCLSLWFFAGLNISMVSWAYRRLPETDPRLSAESLKLSSKRVAPRSWRRMRAKRMRDEQRLRATNFCQQFFSFLFCLFFFFCILLVFLCFVLLICVQTSIIYCIILFLSFLFYFLL